MEHISLFSKSIFLCLQSEFTTPAIHTTAPFFLIHQGCVVLGLDVSRQQFPCLALNRNPRLNVLEPVANGLNSEVRLIPEEKLEAVNAVLEGRGVGLFDGKPRAETKLEQKSLADAP